MTKSITLIAENVFCLYNSEFNKMICIGGANMIFWLQIKGGEHYEFTVSDEPFEGSTPIAFAYSSSDMLRYQTANRKGCTYVALERFMRDFGIARTPIILYTSLTKK